MQSCTRQENISAQKNTLITPSVPTLNTATGEANASGAYTIQLSLVFRTG